MKRFSGIVCLAALLAAGGVASASELFGTIWYKGQPLASAEITVQDKKTQTNAKGYYSINLDPGSYKLGIKMPDGKIREEKADVFPQDTEKNLKLE
jgi:carboxypeptidase family protein